MKKFKKSEIAIYVRALMLVTAGYFNYSAFATAHLRCAVLCWGCAGRLSSRHDELKRLCCGLRSP